MSELPRVLYDPAAGILSYDVDDSRINPAIAFAQLAPGTVIVAADFIIV